MPIEQWDGPAAAGFAGVVALDGPSGTGKSTVARQLARRLGAQYLDTGAMYRAATVAVLEAGVDPTDSARVIEVVAGCQIGVATDPESRHTTLNGRNVDAEIRSAETTAAVSAVSAVPEVRRRLVADQREIIGHRPTVAEGRDIGSVVWPTAELKVYLTATEEVRARRRAGELGDRNLSGVAAALRRRDAADAGRAASPLHRPDGAVEVDTSQLSISEVVELLTRMAVSADRTAHPARHG
ncbi:MAG: (d)CMP kinase [Actinomycetota bacterium]|nr:(d)CMP kinase [Actinomycetota bacterium]MDQ2957412.1 (d)CMP kinase [Actinomycetota bacterium]